MSVQDVPCKVTWWGMALLIFGLRSLNDNEQQSLARLLFSLKNEEA